MWITLIGWIIALLNKQNDHKRLFHVISWVSPFHVLPFTTLETEWWLLFYETDNKWESPCISSATVSHKSKLSHNIQYLWWVMCVNSNVWLTSRTMKGQCHFYTSCLRNQWPLSSDYLTCLYCEENAMYSTGQYITILTKCRVDHVYHNANKQSAVCDQETCLTLRLKQTDPSLLHV